MRRRLLALALALGIPAAAFAPFVVSEGTAEGQKSDAGVRYDPENVTGISQYMETVLKGVEKYGQKDYVGASDVFKRAIQANPKHPLAPYLLGETYLALANLGEAEAAFRQAEEVADAKNPTLRGTVLFALADCYERGKKLDQAKAAWEKYNDHLAKFADAGGHPATAAARIKMIDDVVKLEKQSAEVRARIAAEKADGGGAGDAAKKK